MKLGQNKIQFENMSIKEARNIWESCSVFGELHFKFMDKLRKIHGDKTVILVCTWFELLGTRQMNFADCNEKEIVKRFENAKWLIENVELLSVHKCDKCGKINLILDDETNEKYHHFDIIRNKCHTLTTDNNVEYGSVLDCYGEDSLKVSVKMCDCCLARLKGVEMDEVNEIEK